MAPFLSGPTDIQQGNLVNFVVQFLDATGATIVPQSPSMFITYTNTSNTSQTDTITLSATNTFFIGTWSSTSASLGLANYGTLSSGSTVPIASGQIRVINRMGSS